MVIEIGSEDKIEQAILIATGLPQWFTSEAIKNIEIDLHHNHFFVAVESNQVIGFICFTTYSGKALLLWMGVKVEAQGKGVGSMLLKKLEDVVKQLGLHSIEVETLPDEDDYKPYKQTRNFYYKSGFECVLYKKATTEGWDDQILLEKKI